MTEDATKSKLKNLIALGIGLFLAIAVLEIAGRFIPMETGFNAAGAHLRYTPDMGSYSRYHAQLGYEIDPAIGDFIYESKHCVKTDPVTITTDGTRVTSYNHSANNIGNGPSIAVLGDSMMMAREVGDYEHFSAILQKLLPTSTVTNFGTAGYSTVQEYISYSVKVADTDPDIIVLAFQEINDVIEGYQPLALNDPLIRSRPFMSADSDEIVPPAMKPEEAEQAKSAASRLNRTLLRNSFTYFAVSSLLNKLGGKVVSRSPGAQVAKSDGNEYWWKNHDSLHWLAMYQNPPDSVFEAAWRDTERAILKLHEKILSHNRRLVVVLLPMPQSRALGPSLKSYADQFGASEPPDFELRYPATRLKDFGVANGIDVIDLYPQFQTYMESHELEMPLFYFRCDGHYNPIGHYLAANGLAEHLLQQGLVDEEDIRQDPDYLEKSPEELLGPEAYKAIFEKGNVYTGNSLLNQPR